MNTKHQPCVNNNCLSVTISKGILAYYFHLMDEWCRLTLYTLFYNINISIKITSILGYYTAYIPLLEFLINLEYYTSSRCFRM